jgi:ABC-type multidrug transport system fused ATPase/permease subunit
LYANKNASEYDINEALRKANAGFVKEMGLDSYVGSTAV